MARPKGVIQKRDESKYILPSGVSLLPGQDPNYRKDTKLIFIDSTYGEFVSTFKALQDAGSSTHPKAVQKRREDTNMRLYGGTNPHCNVEVRNKFKSTMIERYGVEHALKNEALVERAKKSSKLVNKELALLKQKTTNLERYGVENPMYSDEIKIKLKKTNLEKYGYENPAQSPVIKAKFFETLEQNNNILSSSGELELKEYIQSLGFTCKNSFLGGANPKQIDIKIENSNICIEFNGAYWHSEANKNMYPNYHLEKTLLAQEKGLKLIHIFDFEWRERQNQVKSFLRSALNKNEHKISARKTEIREVPTHIADNFLEKYHILGSCKFIKAYGLYYNNELYCMVTIGRHHRNSKDYVLSRFIGKDNYTVVGGLSKLTKHIKSEYGEVSTWIDNRFANSSGWEKAGWKVIDISKPDYFYYNIKTGKIVSKQSRKKNLVGTPEYMTEHQHAKLDGLMRIYDCGKIKLTTI